MMHINTIRTNGNKNAVAQDEIIGANYEYELKTTDYIIIKISEAVADGDIAEAERIRSEHAETIARRKELRRLINEIKAKWES